MMRADPRRLIAATEQLLPAVIRERPGTCPLGPSVDGEFLPQDPIDAMAAGRAHPIPLVVGSNADEATLIMRMLRYAPSLPAYIMPVTETGIEAILAHIDTESRAQLVAAYPGYPKPLARRQMGQDSVLTQAVWRIAEAHGQHQPTYVYRYDYAPRTLRWLGLGASHGAELLRVLAPT